MNIAYIYPEKLPAKNARSISVINTACNLAKYADVSLIYENSNEDIKKFYKIECDKLNFIPIKREMLFLRSNKIFNYNLSKYLDKFDYFYVRHLKTAEYLLKKGKKVIFEVHEIFSYKNQKIKELELFVLNNVNGLVVINTYIKKLLKEKFNIRQPIKVVRNGANIDFNYIKKDFTNIKEMYYIGSFQKWKGIEFLLDAVKDIDIKLNLVGNITDEIKGLAKDVVNVELLGYKSQEEVKKILREAKLTVIPNTKNIDSEFSTPIKLYEYLQSSCIVLASDLPTIKEIIKDGENGFLFKIGNKYDFINKINYILNLSVDELLKISRNGFETGKKFTWDNRAKEIVAFIKDLNAKNNIPSS